MGAAWARTTGALLWSMVAAPPARAEVQVHREGPAPLIESGQTLSVLSWNVQFAGSREAVFFYDDGPAVHVREPLVRRTVERIAEVIRESSADVVMLQEVDRSSDRTARIDQHAELLARTDYPCHLSTPYFRSPFVPHPPHAPLGRMDMHLSVFSRYRLERAVRWQLPLLRESWLRQRFNLRRALLQVDLPLVAGGRFRAFATHLSAFSRGDGTLPRQVAAVMQHLTQSLAEGVPWILAGDFNALPPGDDADRLGSAASLYGERDTPVGALFDAFRPAVPALEHARHPERYRTLLPPGATQADRAIDHAFTSRDVAVVDARVLRHVTDVSDHLPLLVTLRVP